MKKYLLKRILFSIFSLIVVTILIMILIFVLKDRQSIFNEDAMLSRLNGNAREVYKCRQLQKFGYIDFIEYSDYIEQKLDEDGIEDEAMRYFYKQFPKKESLIQEGKIYSYWYYDEETGDEEKIEGENPYLLNFRTEMEAKGYKVTFLDYTNALPTKAYYAVKDRSLFYRIVDFFGGLFYFETTNDVETNKEIERGIHWEWDYYSNTPALVGSGTRHKYLLYYKNENSIFSSQHLFHINLGTSFTGSTKDLAIEDILLAPQGTTIEELTPYPTQFEAINAVLSNPAEIDCYARVFSSSTPVATTDTVAKEGKVYYSDNTTVIELNVGDEVPAGSLENTIIEEFEVNTHELIYNFVNPRYDLRIYTNSEATEFIGSYSPLANNRAFVGNYCIYLNESEIVTVVVPTSTDYHSATYSYGEPYDPNLYVDDYTIFDSVKDGKSMLGYSLLIGILATILAYILGLPIGIWMARRKDKIVDKIGTGYIIFIIAVPSLAYIAIFRTLGGFIGLPKTFLQASTPAWLVYVLPVISLALPSIAGLMRWIRRYMIDQSNADYVKFARSQGMSEGEIFVKHIAKNASIPIVHGIPGAILGCITGAFITERFYLVPGTGKLLTTAINQSNNGIIVGLAFFYAAFSIISLIVGDLLLTVVDPRISFVEGGKK